MPMTVVDARSVGHGQVEHDEADARITQQALRLRHDIGVVVRL